MTFNSIPNAGHPIAGGQRVDPTWYKWLRELDREARDTGADLSAEIEAIARKLGSPDGTIDGIPESSQSLTALPPLAISGNQITLSTLTADTAGELFGISRDAYGRISALRPVVAGAGITIDGTTDPDEIAIVNGNPNPMTTLGDLIRADTGGVPERLPVGTNGQVLTVVSGEPSWATNTALVNPMTTAGDIITGGVAGAPQRLGIGSTGQVLKVVAGAPAWAAESGGGGGLSYAWEGFHSPIAVNTGGATIFTQGLAALTTVGTVSSPAVANTSAFTSRIRRLNSATAATNAIAVNRDGAGSGYLLVTSSGRAGGFQVFMEAGVGAGATVASHRFFLGLNAASAPSDVNPSSQIQILGIGYDSADTQVQFMHNDGSGTATKGALGAGFPKPTAIDTNVYTLSMTHVAGSGVVNYAVTDLSSGNTATGSVSTDLPTSFLSFVSYMSAGGTSTAIGLTFGGYRARI